MRSTLCVIVVLSTLALGGCGYYRWDRSGATAADFQRESAECQQGQGQAPGAAWETCMTGRGWRYSGSWF
jgi:hypothetical protein